jgi:hypothetical protein
LPVVAMFVNGLGQNVQSLERTTHRCFLPSFGSFGQTVLTCLFYTLQVGIHILIFFLANLAKGNMNFCHHLVSVVCHPFTFHILIFSSENPQPNELKHGRCFLPSFGSFGQTVSEEKNLKNQPIRKKSRLWRSIFLYI